MNERPASSTTAVPGGPAAGDRAARAPAPDGGSPARRHPWRTLVLAGLLLAGCAAAPVGRQDLLEFLVDGLTRRDDVQLKLGEPSGEYEEARILAYRLRRDEAGYVLVGRRNDWSGVQYNLMLVFDAEGVLRRHSLVEVRAP